MSSPTPIAAAILLGFATQAAAYDPYPFQRSDGKWGYVDDDHCWVIEPQFGYAREFTEDLAAVRMGAYGSKWGYIDLSGNLAIGFEYLYAYPFSEGLAGVAVGEKFGFIDRYGSTLIRPQFTEVSMFSDGLAAVKIDPLSGDGPPAKYGYISTSGDLKINPRFYLAGYFSNGMALVVNGDVYGSYAYIGVDGEVISHTNSFHDNAAIDGDAFSSGLAPAGFEGNKTGYIDLRGAIVISPSFEEASPFNEGLAAVRYQGKSGYIDAAGNFVFEPQFDGAGSFNDGFASVLFGDEWGYIDKTGAVVIPPQFAYAGKFTNGRASIQLTRGGEFYTIDRSGRILLDPTCGHTR